MDITLCLGYRADAVIEVLGSGVDLGIRLQYSIEQEQLGTGGALKYAVQNHSGPVIVMNGDTYLEYGIDSLLEMCHPEEDSVILVLKKAKNANLRGCVDLANDGRIKRFVEKPVSVSDEVLISAGVYLFNQIASVRDFPSAKFSLEDDFFPLMAKEVKLRGIVTDRYFIDIGIPESLEQFEQDILQGKINDYSE